jgi:hypothetical protein
LLAFAAIHGEKAGFWLNEDVAADQAFEFGPHALGVAGLLPEVQGAA